ncbi:MAG: hypothetical protein HZA51_07495 [Planctomycetes bacterium]|nr:hypothetical protein [Planctomycetota bacterium]
MSGDEKENAPRIELEPVVSETIPRHIPEADRAALAEAGLPESSPIPEKPLHVCPNCDYNLTGLASRRCPECGEEFTLHEARMCGVEMSAPIQRMLRRERFEQIKAYVGSAAIVLSVWWQNVRPGSVSGWLGLQLSPRGTVMLALMPMLFVIIWGYKTVWDRSWSDAIFLAGAATGALAVLFASF